MQILLMNTKEAMTDLKKQTSDKDSYIKELEDKIYKQKVEQKEKKRFDSQKIAMILKEKDKAISQLEKELEKNSLIVQEAQLITKSAKEHTNVFRRDKERAEENLKEIEQ